MKFVAVEDNNPTDSGLEVEKAIKADEALDSTEPSKILKVVNYKAELEKLKAANGEAIDNEDSNEQPTEKQTDNDTEDEFDGQADTDTIDTTENTDEETNNNDDASDDSSPDEPTDEDSEDAEVAIEAFIQLRRLERIAQDTVNKGGISKQQSAILAISMTAIEKRLGFKKPDIIAVENFSTIADRHRFTRIAIEGIKDTIREIWEAIKRFFISIYKWFKDALFGQKTKINKTKERIEELKALEKSIKEQNQVNIRDAARAILKEKKVFDSPAVKKLCTDYGICTFEKMRTDSTDYYKFNTTLIQDFVTKNLIQKNNFVLESIEKQLGQGMFNSAMSHFVITKSDTNGLGLKTAEDRFIIGETRPYEEVLMSDTLPGFSRLIVSVVKDGKEADASSERYKNSISYQNEKENKECAVLFPKYQEAIDITKDLVTRYLNILQLLYNSFEKVYVETSNRQQDVLYDLRTSMQHVNDAVVLEAFRELKSNLNVMNRAVFVFCGASCDRFREHADALAFFITDYYKELNKRITVQLNSNP